MLAALLIGFGFGFFGSMPVAGPASALVLSRGLVGRFLSGAMIGVGCGLAEGIYAGLAAYGFATFLAGYPFIEGVSHVVAAVIMFLLGVTFVRYKGATEATARNVSDKALQSAGLGFWITILNPALIATWTASATTLASAGVTLTQASALPFGAGVAVGVGSWFGIFTYLMKRYRERFKPELLNRIIRVIGALLFGLGVYFTYRAVRHFVG